MRRSFLLLLIILALLSALPGFAQDAALTEVLMGKTTPLSLKLQQLDGNWRCMTLAPAADAAEALVKMIVTAQMHMPLAPNLVYTRGKTLAIAGETSIIAYAFPTQPLHTPEQAQHGDAKLAPLRPDSEVFLTLLNIRTMGNLLNIRPFDLKQEIAENQPREMTTKDAEEKSMNNMRQLAIATLMYAQNHNEQFPAMDTAEQWDAVLNIDKQVLTRPGMDELYQPNIALSKQALGDIADAANTVLAFEATPWPDGMRLIAFVDGHVQLVNEQQWQALKAKLVKKH